VSGGEAKTVDTAKKGMTYAIMGLLLVFFAFLIVSFIGHVTHVDCLSNIAGGISDLESVNKRQLALPLPDLRMHSNSS